MIETNSEGGVSMQIKTVGQLKKELENIDDNFEIELLVEVQFRGNLTNYDSHELHLEDVGYSEKFVIFSAGEAI